MKASKSQTSDCSANTEAPFLHHLEDLRWTLLKSFIAFMVAAILVIAFLGKFADLLTWPYDKAIEMTRNPDNPDLQGLKSNSPGAAFIAIFQMCFLGGLGLSIPFILFFVGQFLAPGLKPNEKKYLLPGCIAGFLLFLIGSFLSFLFMIPTTLVFAIKMNRVLNFDQLWDGSSYYSMVAWMTLSVGFSFQFPLVLLILVRLGILSTKKLQESRKLVLVIILIVSALVTPGGDPITLTMFSLPLYGLYEIALLIARRIQPREINNSPDEVEWNPR